MPFDKKTVFILGAGSSEKFPLGSKLVREIISDSVFSSNPALHENGFREDQYLEFLKQLKFADPSSIDAFLEENPDLIDIGRIAIAHNLVKGENEHLLFPPQSSEGNWYKSFADYVGITKNGKPSENNIAIFTYNYERSLEHYLTRVIQHRMRIDEKQARIIREKIPVYHLHGTLGSLDETNPNYRPYNSIVNTESLKIASRSIRIISEQSDEYDCNSILKRNIKEAEQIYFFGFGYHPVNMRRLMNSGLRDKLLAKDGCTIISLRTKITEPFWDVILKEQFEGLLDKPRIPAFSIQEYLREIGFGNLWRG